MLLDNLKTEIIIPGISLLFALALIYFFWGVVQYIRNLDNPTGRTDGQRHMFWGIVGLAIMLSAFGIMNFVFNTVNKPGAEQPDILREQSFTPQ